MRSEMLPLVDSLIKEYLTFRGFNSTLRHLETELKKEKDLKFKVDKLIEEVVHCVDSHDIDRLKNLWEFFNTKVFNNLTEENSRTASQFENDVYKLYLANCVHHKLNAKCTEFFEKMIDFLRANPLWTEWFALPYIADAKECEPFRKYFAKKWQEAFLISLHNFFAISLSVLTMPLLTECISEVMQTDVSSGTPCETRMERSSSRSRMPSGHSMTDDLMDDFAIIAQCSNNPRVEGSKSSLKSLLKNIAGGKKSTD
uniref:LisH domain-containing protein n=1 Tax=Steinernema glaseri TaxID=37863 RepID=A0A1I7Y477_9BILA